MSASPAAPRLLVLLCTHNGAPFLGPQLRSLATQSWLPRAVEVHDWGSTDQTWHLLQAFSREQQGRMDVRLNAHAKAPGPKASFLQALQHTLATRDDFDLLLWCDQDDIWHSDKLSRFAQAWQRDPDCDLLYSDVRLIDSTGLALAPRHLGPGGRFGRPMDITHPSTLWVNTVPGMAMAATRRFLDAGRAAWTRPEWVMHDWAWCLWAHLSSARVHVIDEALVDYRQHAGNVLGGMAGTRRGIRAQWAEGRARVRQIQRQYRMCCTLPGIHAGRRPEAHASRWRAARQVLAGHSLPRLQALKVALGLLLAWQADEDCAR